MITPPALLSRQGDRPEIAALLASDEFLSATAQLASQLGRDVAGVRAEAAVYVREMRHYTFSSCLVCM